MTHDELLIGLEDDIEAAEIFGYVSWRNVAKALRAVVEFIQDVENDNGIIANEEFNQGVRATCRSIIQAIEKELK